VIVMRWSLSMRTPECRFWGGALRRRGRGGIW
jgi:hypothetical protein